MALERLVHRIWFGPHPMRRELLDFGRSWERHGYTVQLWTERNLPALINHGAYEDVARRIVNTGCGVPELGRWVQQADIVSYELIYRYGGIYANTDMECLRPLDPILEDVTAFAGRETQGVLSNALMGCTPAHPFFEAVITELPYRIARMPLAVMSEQTGPHLLTAVNERLHELTVFPQAFFCPYGYDEMHREYDEWPDAYTSHHWGHTRD